MIRVLVVLMLVAMPSLADACQQFYDVLFERQSNGTVKVVANATVTVVQTGTSTPVTIYSDPTCSSTMPNPTTTIIDGSFGFFVQDGVYDLLFSKTGVAFLNATNVHIFDPLGKNIVTPAMFRTTDLCATGTGIIDQIGANVRSLFVNEALTCSVTKTSPSTLEIIGLRSGSVTVSASQTLTVNGPVTVPHGLTFWTGTGTVTFGSGAGPTPYGNRGTNAISYAATMDVDASLGRFFEVSVTNNSNFAFNLPIKGNEGQEVCIQIKNTSGGALGTATFTSYKLGAAWTQPANGTNRQICFRKSGSNWYETSRSAADVSN